MDSKNTKCAFVAICSRFHKYSIALDLKNKSAENIIAQKTRNEYLANLNEKNIADNKQFWKIVKTLLSDKIKSSNNIFLVRGDETINEDDRNATVLNNFLQMLSKTPKYQGIAGLTHELIIFCN